MAYDKLDEDEVKTASRRPRGPSNGVKTFCERLPGNR